MLAEDPVQLALVVLLLGHVVVLACRRRPCRGRVIVELEVICFAAYQTGRVVMKLRERHKAFQEWFTPRRRRRAGGTLLAIWAVGIFIYPGQHWIYVLVPGIMWFFSAWPPELHDKR